MKKIKIGVFGPGGRMGEDVVKKIKKFESLELTALCENKGHPLVGKKVSNINVTDNKTSLIKNSEVIIDFTTPSGTIELLKNMNKENINTALVTGTTGYTSNQEKNFGSLIHGKKILRSFNMSIGINLLKNIVKLASKTVGEVSDVEITEIHHNKKKDTPSGTSISLAQSVNEGNSRLSNFSYREKNNNKLRNKNEIGFSSIRGGDIVGEHTVLFFLDGERLELKHAASSRSIFSLGALNAACWILKKNLVCIQ